MNDLRTKHYDELLEMCKDEKNGDLRPLFSAVVLNMDARVNGIADMVIELHTIDNLYMLVIVLESMVTRIFDFGDDLIEAIEKMLEILNKREVEAPGCVQVSMSERVRNGKEGKERMIRCTNCGEWDIVWAGNTTCTVCYPCVNPPESQHNEGWNCPACDGDDCVLASPL